LSFSLFHFSKVFLESVLLLFLVEEQASVNTTLRVALFMLLTVTRDLSKILLSSAKNYYVLGQYLTAQLLSWPAKQRF